MCEFCVWILGVDGRSRYLYNVLGRYLCILSALSVHNRYLLLTVNFFVADPRLVCVWFSDHWNYVFHNFFIHLFKEMYICISIIISCYTVQVCNSMSHII